jgi:uncharacterized membrane protein YfcA
MVPVLVSFLPLPQTPLLVGIIHWFGDIWKMLLFRQGLRWRLILTFGIPGILASVAGGLLVFQAPEALLSRVLGGLLIAYVVFLLTKERFKVPETSSTALAGGALSGFFAGVFGIGGAVRGAFLAAFDLPKAVYIATAGAIGLAIDTGRLFAYVSAGTQLDRALLWGLLLFIPVSFVGAKLAERIVKRTPQQRFRMVIAVFLCLIGLKLLLFPS